MQNLHPGEASAFLQINYVWRMCRGRGVFPCAVPADQSGALQASTRSSTRAGHRRRPGTLCRDVSCVAQATNAGGERANEIYYIHDDLPAGAAVEDAVREHGGESFFRQSAARALRTTSAEATTSRARPRTCYPKLQHAYSGLPHILPADEIYRAGPGPHVSLAHPDPIASSGASPAVTLSGFGVAR